MSLRIPLLLFAILAIPVAGCGGASYAPAAKPASAPNEPMRFQVAPNNADAAGAGAKPANAPADFKIERKIIFNGSLEVNVKDFSAARTQLTELVSINQGYYSKSEIVGEAGSRIVGTFTIKVPAEKFQSTVDAITKLGATIKNSSDSQDVTEEFIDIEARVKNLKNEEEVLNKLLKDASGRLDDVFKIREQIRQIRGDIERAEGRLKALTSLTSLSTITLVMTQNSDYIPPPVEAPPTFGDRVSGAFSASLGWLKSVGEAIAIALTVAAPWLPFAIIVGLGLRRYLRTA